MKPAEWNTALHPDIGWQAAYGTVAAQVKLYLDSLDPCDEKTTAELVEALYPETLARGEGIVARQRMFKALRMGIKHHTFDEYSHAGPAKRLYGANVHPPVWHSRREKPDSRVYLRQVDGTGSWHVCNKVDAGAVAFVREEK